MSREKPVSCALVRKALQEWHDGGLPSHPAPFVGEHVSSCAECAAFARSLESLAARLRETLDSRLAGLPAPRIDEVLLRESARPRPVEEKRRHPSSAAWTKRLPWAAVPVAAAILAALLGPVLARQVRTRRIVRHEIALFVDQLYAEPLLGGVESALDGGPDGLRLLDEAQRDVESWLGGGDPSGAGFD